MAQPKTVSCPRCGAPVVWGPQERFRPFCSERCKLMDLGAWATEKYKVPAPPPQRGERAEDEDR